MNLKFMKALHQLDAGKYEEAEENIKLAIEECDSEYERLEIRACYAELLCKLERYDEAMECVNYILENNDDYGNTNAGEIANDVKAFIENLQEK